MKWRNIKKFLALGMACCMINAFAPPVFAVSSGEEMDSVDSKSIKLYEVNGEVTVKKGSKILPAKAGIRVFDGSVITTSKDSSLLLELDDSKYIKADENTKLKVSKSKKTNTISVVSGTVFFDVAKPLTSEETMSIRTTSLTMGIKGTSGAVNSSTTQKDDGTHDKNIDTFQLYEGTVVVENGISGQSETLKTGSQIVVENNPRIGYSDSSTGKLNPDGSNYLSLSLSEIAKNETLQDKIINNGGLTSLSGLSEKERKEALNRAYETNKAEEKSQISKFTENYTESAEKTAPNERSDTTTPSAGTNPSDPLPKPSTTPPATTTAPSNNVGNSDTSYTPPTTAPPTSSETSPPSTEPTPPAIPDDGIPPSGGGSIAPEFLVGTNTYTNWNEAMAAAAPGGDNKITITSGTHTINNSSGPNSLVIASGAKLIFSPSETHIIVMPATQSISKIEVKSGGTLQISGGYLSGTTINVEAGGAFNVTGAIEVSNTTLTINGSMSGLDYLSGPDFNTDSSYDSDLELIFGNTFSISGGTYSRYYIDNNSGGVDSAVPDNFKGKTGLWYNGTPNDYWKLRATDSTS